MILVKCVRRLGHLALILCFAAQAAFADDTPAPGMGTISGRIVLEDGAPAKTEVSLHSETFRPGNNGGTSNASQGRFRGTYSIKVEPGEVWLKCYVKGFAPLALGPFDVAAGQTIDNTLIQLKRGREARVRIVSTDAKPVAGASIMLSPFLGKSSNGESTSIPVDAKGEIVLKNLADATYAVEVNAPGHEPLSATNQTLSSDGINELKMTRALPASGVVLMADGRPAKGAKIHKKLEGAQRGARSFYGTVAATSDDAGKFSLDQLTSTLQYLFVVEYGDESRAVLRNMQPGVAGVEVRLPKDQNLRVIFHGDLNKLPMRGGRRTIVISQPLVLAPPSPPHSSEINGVAEVKPTDDGGVAEYKGLVTGEVLVRAGVETVKANVVENGLTEVTIDLDKDKAK